MAKYIENLINEAIKFYQQKDLIQVTKVLNTLLNIDPNHPFGLFFSGVILNKKKNISKLSVTMIVQYISKMITMNVGLIKVFRF